MERTKSAVVTGGNRGLGLAISELLAEQGYTLTLVATNPESLAGAAAKLSADHGIEVQTKVCNLSERTEIARLGKELRRDSVALDVLVNNAGSFQPGGVLSEPEGTLENMLATNVQSAYYLTRELMPLLQEPVRAHIVNMCSIASLAAYEGGGSYSISKFALLGFSKNLRHELRETGIKVTSIMPGAAWTDSWAASGIPESRIMQAADVAEVVRCALAMSNSAVLEDVVLRPQNGDL